jgi:hypothetical protein
MTAAPTLTLLREDEPPRAAPDLRSELASQICDALALVDLPPDAFLHWPFGELDALSGGMAPGDVWFVCAFSGNGKTTFLSSALDAWFAAGKRVFVMPLETRPKVFRTYWACQRLGIAPGEVLSGALNTHPYGIEIRKRIREELHLQFESPMRDLVNVTPVRAVNVARLTRAVDEAYDWGADVLIVDHIDHVAGGDGTNLHAESVRVNHAALDLAQEHNLVLLAASQLNNAAMVGGRDRLAQYGPPQPNHVFMGGHKRQIATGMIGLHRKLRDRNADEDPKAYKLAIHEARLGDAEPSTALAPGIMGVTAMKLRNFGQRENQRVYLGVEHGRVVTLNEKDRYGTSPDALRRL